MPKGLEVIILGQMNTIFIFFIKRQKCEICLIGWKLMNL